MNRDTQRDNLEFLTPGRGLSGPLVALLAEELREAHVSEAEALKREIAAVDHGRVGQQVGPYRLERLIGSGGMGAVYEVERVGHSLGQRVALKIVRAAARLAIARERFEQERKILASLAHPNIAALFEIGQTDHGEPYYTMEYVEGLPITEYCSRHVETVEKRIRLLIDVASSLAYAHRSAIVHRDIKPQNILVGTDGRVKLLDFGIARLLDRRVFEPATRNLMPMTPAYAAPEQFRNELISKRTDIYQFGVLSFELLTGRLPFCADPDDLSAWSRAVFETDLVSLAEAVHEAGALAWPAHVDRSTLKELDGDLNLIVQKCLAKASAQRYGSMEALIRDLEAILWGGNVNAAPALAAGTSGAPRHGAVPPVKYLTTADNVRLAWTQEGHGTPLVKAANWLTHLEFDRESPVWSHWIGFLAENFRVSRYDEPGCGMSDWKVRDLSMARWVADLEAVVEASQVREPFVLLGISQGAATAIAYAVRHPERVSHLILYGGYALGWARRGDAAGLRRYEAIVELIRLGWGSENPAFRQVFASRFVPEGRPEQVDWFNELCRRTTSAEVAASLMLARAEVDVAELVPKVRVPTLVVHALHDDVVPIDCGRQLASAITNAQLVELESGNHILLEDEPAWSKFKAAVQAFVGPRRSPSAGT